MATVRHQQNSSQFKKSDVFLTIRKKRVFIYIVKVRVVGDGYPGMFANICSTSRQRRWPCVEKMAHNV